MSSVAQQSGAAEPHPPVACAPEYGWREVVTTRPDGTEECVRVPLTIEDVLHPQFGDVMPENNLHVRIRGYLAEVFRLCTYHDPTAFVFSDLLIYWEDPALKQHAPDVGAAFGVRDRDQSRNSFHCERENARPSVLVEIVSPNTRNNDVEKKLVEYHQARVPVYVILDRERDGAPWQLRGYEYAPGKYAEMRKDEHGRLWLKQIGIWLSTDGQTVICQNKHGKVIGDFEQIHHHAENETTRADAADRRAEAAKARAEAADRRAEAEKALAEAEKTRAEAADRRAEAERALAEAEKVRAEAADRRAKAEKARADAEALARQTDAARLKEMEAEIARLRAQLPPP